MTTLKEGDKAPDFKVRNELGKEMTLAVFSGKKLVLYFYPKDSTPGCTAESCNLRDHYADLKTKGFEVLGVSADGEASHEKFIKKHELPFHLLADTEKEVLNALSKELLSGAINSNSIILMDAFDNGLVFRNQSEKIPKEL